VRRLETIAIHPQAAPALHEIECGLKLNKCQKCGCMKEALQNAEAAFKGSEEPEIRALLSLIEGHAAKMQPIAYDCIGCKKCWGADATIQLANHFEDVEPDACGSECGPSVADAPVVRLQATARDAADKGWPPYPGDYVVGDLTGAVAVCTLSSRDLAAAIVEGGQPHIAIAGRCDTENIGVEKVVLNLLANAHIRHLIICGTEAKGHRTGDAFLQLKAVGVDAKMRVLESASWRPILKNLTLLDVARFREQIEVINLVGVTDVKAILKAARECANKELPPLAGYRSETPALDFEHIRARAPQGLKLDRAGFFIVLPQRERGLILCEHYENNGRLAHVIEGKQAALIASTVVERGFITLLDHAVYLGRELAKAEIALKTGAAYEQDSALGELPPGAADRAAQASDDITRSGTISNEASCK
jgi:tetrahydromethanopterin S-methyltransferase subunit A